MTDVAVTEAPAQTPAQAAAAAVADPQNPQDQWKQNIESILKSLAGFIPFRHEGEFTRIIMALDNLHEDLQNVFASAEPVPPSIGQPDPVLQALVAKNQELEDKMNKLLDALGNSPVVTAASTTATASDAQVTQEAAVPAETYPPGWTKDADGNWVPDGASS